TPERVQRPRPRFQARDPPASDANEDPRPFPAANETEESVLTSPRENPEIWHSPRRAFDGREEVPRRRPEDQGQVEGEGGVQPPRAGDVQQAGPRRDADGRA